MLTKNEIQLAGIVHHSISAGERTSTYDATVGTIMYEGKVISSNSFTLDPRGVVWVISKEEIETKGNHTALATLKTSWAHQGVFALNVGVIDPGWHGPIATALVNFSNEPFELKQGMPFLRLVFFSHAATNASINRQDMTGYTDEIKRKSRGFSKSFLNMHTLVKEVESEVFKLPKWAFYGAWGALIVAIASIFAPIAFSVYTTSQDQQAKMAQLIQRLDYLETKVKDGTNEVKSIDSIVAKKAESSEGAATKPIHKNHK